MLRELIEPVLTADRSLFLWINGLSGSWLDYFLAWPTFLGGNFALMGLVLLLLIIWDKENTLKRFPCIVLAGAAAGIAVYFLKHAVQRERPFTFFYSQINAGQVKVHFMYDIFESRSFPSGHAALVFALVVAVNILYRGKLGFLYPLAFLVAFSRIYTGVHFPLDVMVGAFIGSTMGFCIGLLCKRIQPLNQRLLKAEK